MNKITFSILLTLLILGCKTKKDTIVTINPYKKDRKAIKYAKSITTKDAKELVFTLASKEFEGRKTSEKGQKLAAEFLAKKYKSFGIPSYLESTYLQTIPIKDLINSRRRFTPKKPSENVIAFIEGTEKPEEFLIISSHYDHEGIKNGEIYFGADDNASGTTAVIEIAQAFAKAKEKGHGPKRSILFVNFTGEEKGLLGSKYFVANPIIPLKNVVANLNIDMIGRMGYKHPNDDNYVYVIGADRLSTQLHEINERVNATYINLDLDYKYNEKSDPNKFYKRSDHYNFAKNGIPIIFYFNGVHDDYHKPTDTPEKILLDLLVKRAKLVFHTAWEIANRDERLVVDVTETN